MKKLYCKNFDYYNADKTVNARLVFSIELDKNIIRETTTLHKITESPKSDDKLEHFEKMYNKNKWSHDFTKEIFLGIPSESCDFYFEKHALNFDGEQLIRKAILKIVEPDYKYSLEYIIINNYKAGFYCRKHINGDNDILEFSNELGKISFDDVKEKTKDYFKYIQPDNMNFVIKYNDKNILFQMGFLENTEHSSSYLKIHPSDIYYEMYLLKDNKINKRVFIGKSYFVDMSLLMNNPESMYDTIIKYLDRYKDILSIDNKLNPLFSSNFRRNDERSIGINPACMFEINLDYISYDIYTPTKVSIDVLSSYVYTMINGKEHTIKCNKIHLPFREIVDMFVFDSFHNSLEINYANKHIQYIIDTLNIESSSTHMLEMKKQLAKWRLKNNPSIYMGYGI